MCGTICLPLSKARSGRYFRRPIPVSSHKLPKEEPKLSRRGARRFHCLGVTLRFTDQPAKLHRIIYESFTNIRRVESTHLTEFDATQHFSISAKPRTTNEAAIQATICEICFAEVCIG